MRGLYKNPPLSIGIFLLVIVILNIVFFGSAEEYPAALNKPLDQFEDEYQRCDRGMLNAVGCVGRVIVEKFNGALTKPQSAPEN